MDLIILVAIILIVVICFRRFSNFVYAIAIIDIFLRILTFFQLNIPVAAISNFLATYFPSNIPAILAAYSNGILYTILLWGYVILMIIFEYYIICTFIHRKK